MDAVHLPQKACRVRRRILQMIFQSGSGHIAGPLSSADLLVALYFGGTMAENDRFILSCGHYCPAWYAVLTEAGLFSEKKLETFKEINSPLQGHPHRGSLPGIETSSGPLGQGLSQAAGMALAFKMDASTDSGQAKNRVYCLMSDAEQQEGQVWEAAMFAAKYKLDNLVAIIDRNGIQIDGQTEKVMPLGDISAKYLAFGWNIFEIDGHIYGQILNALESAKQIKGKPTVIIAKTVAGKGVSFMEGKYEWHHGSLTREQLEQALKELP